MSEKERAARKSSALHLAVALTLVKAYLYFSAIVSTGVAYTKYLFVMLSGGQHV